MVELQPSKLAMRVRFPSPAPEFWPAKGRRDRNESMVWRGSARGSRLDQRIDREATDLVTGLKKNGEGEV